MSDGIQRVERQIQQQGTAQAQKKSTPWFGKTLNQVGMGLTNPRLAMINSIVYGKVLGFVIKTALLVTSKTLRFVADRHVDLAVSPHTSPLRAAKLLENRNKIKHIYESIEQPEVLAGIQKTVADIPRALSEKSTEATLLHAHDLYSSGELKKALQLFSMAKKSSEYNSLKESPELQEKLGDLHQLEEHKNEPLNSFCINFCPGLTIDRMKEMIKAGEALGKELVDAAKDPTEWKKLLEKKANLKSAVFLAWLLTSQAAKQDKLYTSGAMRIGKGEHLTAEKLEEFLQKCGPSYARISTHMSEMLKEEGGAKYGLDNTLGKEFPLPSGKKHIHFMQLKDGTFYTKFEEVGCPKMKLDKDFIKNVAMNIDHGVHWVKTRSAFKPVKKAFNWASKVLGLSSKDTVKLGEKKEHVPKEVLKQFKVTMEALYPDKEVARAKYAEGKKFGISKMQEILDKKDYPIDVDIVKADREKGKLKDLIHQYTKPAHIYGYKGEVKGNEVLMPAIGTKGNYGQSES